MLTEHETFANHFRHVCRQVSGELKTIEKVFSRTNWDEFLSWIDGLQAKKTLEHTKGLELIHVKSLGSSFSKMKLNK